MNIRPGNRSCLFFREMDRTRGDVRVIHWKTFSSDVKSSDSSSHHPKFGGGCGITRYEPIGKGNMPKKNACNQIQELCRVSKMHLVF